MVLTKLKVYEFKKHYSTRFQDTASHYRYRTWLSTEQGQWVKQRALKIWFIEIPPMISGTLELPVEVHAVLSESNAACFYLMWGYDENHSV